MTQTEHKIIKMFSKEYQEKILTPTYVKMLEEDYANWKKNGIKMTNGARIDLAFLKGQLLPDGNKFLGTAYRALCEIKAIYLPQYPILFTLKTPVFYAFICHGELYDAVREKMDEKGVSVIMPPSIIEPVTEETGIILNKSYEAHFSYVLVFKRKPLKINVNLLHIFLRIMEIDAGLPRNTLS